MFSTVSLKFLLGFFWRLISLQNFSDQNILWVSDASSENFFGDFEREFSNYSTITVFLEKIARNVTTTIARICSMIQEISQAFLPVITQGFFMNVYSKILYNSKKMFKNSSKKVRKSYIQRIVQTIQKFPCRISPAISSRNLSEIYPLAPPRNSTGIL